MEDCNYRGVSLLSTALKVYERVIKGRRKEKTGIRMAESRSGQIDLYKLDIRSKANIRKNNGFE